MIMDDRHASWCASHPPTMANVRRTQGPKRLLRPALCAAGALALVVAAEAQSRQGAAGTSLRSLVLRFQTSSMTGGSGSTGGNGGVINGDSPNPISRVTVRNPSITPPP